MDDQEAVHRGDSHILSGSEVQPVASSGENLATLFSNLFKNKVNYDLSPEKIVSAHRLGAKPNTQLSDKRKIPFKLSDRDLKQDLLGACRTSKPPSYSSSSCH